LGLRLLGCVLLRRPGLGLCLTRGKPSILSPANYVNGIEVGLQILEFAVMFLLEMFHQLFELSLRSIDLLLKQVGPFLQIATDVTHGVSPLSRTPLK
jgi:hypothetical protein